MQVTKWDGKPISRPGWYSGIPIERYHSASMCEGLAVSSSDLRKAWAKSPAHMFCEWAENPNRKERKFTDEMLTGACAHHLLLGEDDFRTKFVSFPEFYPDKKTGLRKPWHMGADYCKGWAEQQLSQGRVPVKLDVLESIVEMARSLAREPLINDGLLEGHIETSGFFKDTETDLWIKVRPDVVPMTDEYVDLKTASEVTTPALMSSIRSYGYHQQGALIWEVCEALGQPFGSFMLMFVETDAPYCARSVLVHDEDLARGRLQNRAMLRAIRRSIDANHFAGPGEGNIETMGLALDERKRIDERLKIEGLA